MVAFRSAKGPTFMVAFRSAKGRTFAERKATLSTYPKTSGTGKVPVLRRGFEIGSKFEFRTFSAPKGNAVKHFLSMFSAEPEIPAPEVTSACAVGTDWRAVWTKECRHIRGKGSFYLRKKRTAAGLDLKGRFCQPRPKAWVVAASVYAGPERAVQWSRNRTALSGPGAPCATRPRPSAPAVPPT
jgi:hypothetical protein